MELQSPGEEIDHRVLLLPLPPTEVSHASFNAAYGPAIRELLDGKSRSRLGAAVRLDIALDCRPYTQDVADATASWFDYYEKAIASLYELVIYISTEDDVKLDYTEMPDVAIILVNSLSKEAESFSSEQRKIMGPLVPVETLASSSRPWSVVYAIEGEAGERFYKSFVNLRRSLPATERGLSFTTYRVEGGPSLQVKYAEHSGHSPAQDRSHLEVIVGGTFDHLHAGHKLLLTATALLLKPVTAGQPQHRRLIVGITGDKLLTNKKFAEHLESWEDRQHAVFSFLSRVMNFDGSQKHHEERFNEPGPNGKAVRYAFENSLVIECVEIWDPFGPTITVESVTALVVSGETRSGGQAVNEKRVEKHWKELEIFEVNVLDSQPPTEAATGPSMAFQSKISSTEIRRRLHEG